MSYYGSTDYSYNSDFNLRVRDMKKGNLDFGWLDDAREKIEVRPKDPRRGLEISDCEVGPSATVDGTDRHTEVIDELSVHDLPVLEQVEVDRRGACLERYTKRQEECSQERQPSDEHEQLLRHAHRRA